jgi:hypothetical protein
MNTNISEENAVSVIRVETCGTTCSSKTFGKNVIYHTVLRVGKGCGLLCHPTHYVSDDGAARSTQILYLLIVIQGVTADVSSICGKLCMINLSLSVL